jgi:hypothetical protein
LQEIKEQCRKLFYRRCSSERYKKNHQILYYFGSIFVWVSLDSYLSLKMDLQILNENIKIIIINKKAVIDLHTANSTIR